MRRNVKKAYREIDGVTHVGVITSPGYGAGWSTWNENQLAIDEAVIDWLYDCADEVDLDDEYSDVICITEEETKSALEKYLIKLGYENVYLGSAVERLYITWIPEGTTIHIEEYDGSETIQRLEDIDLITL